MSHHCAEDRPCPVPPHPLKLQQGLEARRYGYTADPNANFGLTQFFGHPDTNAATGHRIGLNDGTLYDVASYAPNTPIANITTQATREAPLRGPINLLIVLVNFSDKGFAPNAMQHFQDLFFSTGRRIPTGSVNEYFQDVSGGLISITGNVFGPYQLPFTSAYYANKGGGLDPPVPNAATMADQTVDQMVRAGINIAPYDNPGRYGQFVDVFVIIHAGIGAEEMGGDKNLDIWSHKGVLPNTRTIGTTSIKAYLTIPETAKIGVCAHEIGHLLFGWPDFYDTTGATGKGVGGWCLMSGGSWGGGGDTPTHPSAWCKAQQQWVDVVESSLDSSTFVNQQWANFTFTTHFRTIHKLWPNPSRGGKEYFLAENRSATGYDQYLPGEGLLVWHVDDDVETSNTIATRPRVALENAGGDNELFRNPAYLGDTTNAFPGSTLRQVVNGTTYWLNETTLFRPFLEKYYA